MRIVLDEVGRAPKKDQHHFLTLEIVVVFVMIAAVVVINIIPVLKFLMSS